ncbi:trans-sulfuration enzyme family protein [Deinococcus cellulosilyticus]|uniref:Methionine gamma-lyase n=1 Tax=Deinococcus cellulosilyticus (strain DSM 18568 / NBRC 106333 / KACC 11606 / 5516J-15) TaxID=1223518 RepID=A0A511N6Y4_DEIC1|nr:PLP-dependent aspartate aminotransferase family protein [Deinococcus cellulosilyticus]GEM48605.1 methionine gamma-lyase [Deinococcus cellulosilyticus NBRC 106333 = KACC 11606]
MSGFNTKAVHAGGGADPQTGAHATPIYQTSTFTYFDAEQGRALFAGEKEGYIYTRISNPTTRALEVKLAALEGAEDAVAFSSGMAAISALMVTVLKSGDEMAFLDPIYGGTDGFFQEILTKFGVTIHRCHDLDALQNVLSDRVKMVFFEPVTNPTLKVWDVEKVVNLARAVGALVVVDNTFPTPYLFRPLEHGADVVVHSATKYLSGHGDLIAGVVAGKADLMHMVRFEGLRHLGGALGPFEAFLLMRGIKTLPIRMDAHARNAQKVAEYLQGHPAVRAVHYAGLRSHPSHEQARRYLKSAGGVLAIELDGGFAACARFLDSLKLFTQAVSLGDVESLACHPASTTHSPMPEEAKKAVGVTDGLVRLSIGIEDADDLIADLEQALRQVKGEDQRELSFLGSSI